MNNKKEFQDIAPLTNRYPEAEELYTRATTALEMGNIKNYEELEFRALSIEVAGILEKPELANVWIETAEGKSYTPTNLSREEESSVPSRKPQKYLFTKALLVAGLIALPTGAKMTYDSGKKNSELSKLIKHEYQTLQANGVPKPDDLYLSAAKKMRAEDPLIIFSPEQSAKIKLEKEKQSVYDKARWRVFRENGGDENNNKAFIGLTLMGVSFLGLYFPGTDLYYRRKRKKNENK